MTQVLRYFNQSVRRCILGTTFLISVSLIPHVSSAEEFTKLYSCGRGQQVYSLTVRKAGEVLEEVTFVNTGNQSYVDNSYNFHVDMRTSEQSYTLNGEKYVEQRVPCSSDRTASPDGCIHLRNLAQDPYAGSGADRTFRDRQALETSATETFADYGSMKFMVSIWTPKVFIGSVGYDVSTLKCHVIADDAFQQYLVSHYEDYKSQKISIASYFLRGLTGSAWDFDDNKGDWTNALTYLKQLIDQGAISDSNPEPVVKDFEFTILMPSILKTSAPQTDKNIHELLIYLNSKNIAVGTFSFILTKNDHPPFWSEESNLYSPNIYKVANGQDSTFKDPVMLKRLEIELNNWVYKQLLEIPPRTDLRVPRLSERMELSLFNQLSKNIGIDFIKKAAQKVDLAENAKREIFSLAHDYCRQWDKPYHSIGECAPMMKTFPNTAIPRVTQILEFKEQMELAGLVLSSADIEDFRNQVRINGNRLLNRDFFFYYYPRVGDQQNEMYNPRDLKTAPIDELILFKNYYVDCMSAVFNKLTP